MVRAILALVLAAPVFASGDPSVHWKGREHPLARLPVTMPADARDTVQAWAEWAAARELRLDLDEEGRVLIVQPDASSAAARRLELARKTSELCDALLPPPTERLPVDPPAHDEGPAAPPEDPGGLPEDPEGAPAGAGLVHRAPRTQSSWGHQPGEPGTGTAVLFVLRGPKEQEALLDELARRHDYLAAWTAGAKRQVGFLLEWPLLGAYLLDAPGMEEWNPDNELVNHLAQLLVLRRFGRQPYWVVQGFAWHVEMSLQGAIYCFPYRDEFVWATEHTGWEQEVAKRFRAKKPRLDPRGLTGWKRGSYDDERAKLAWATMGFLVREHPEQVADFLERVRVTLEKESRVPVEGGGWSRDTAYELPAERLEALFIDAFGEDVLARAGAWFHAGMPK